MEDPKTDLSTLHQRFIVGLEYNKNVLAKASQKSKTLTAVSKKPIKLLTRRTTAKQLLKIRRMVAYVLRRPGRQVVSF